MTELPPFLTPSPEQEALELGLDHLIFEPLEEDERARAEVQDEETPPLRAYTLLDASQSSDIPICLEGFSNPARCLFDGEAFEDLAEVAPWLVELTRYSDVWDWFVEDGYGNNWGILIHSRLELPRLKTQLKKYLKIDDGEGDVYYFKYYRPEHLNTYLPQFRGDELVRFMKGIEAFYTEDQEDTHKLWQHRLNEEDKLKRGTADLIKTGDPLRIQPASPEDADALIKAVKDNA